MNLDSIKIEELDGEQRELADCIGIENYKKLVLYFGGSYVYVQKADTILKEHRDIAIRKMFTGNNYRAIGVKFNLSENRIRKIINNSK